MRKLFRFKYEPCEGTCYAWCDYLPAVLNKIGSSERQVTVNLMVEAHKALCDSRDYYFGIDMTDTGIFIAHFKTPEKVNIYSSPDFSQCVEQVCLAVLKEKIGPSTGECIYGNSGQEDLGKEILRACVDTLYREDHHKKCPCHIAA